MPARSRLDTLLVDRGLFESRSRARAAILAGEIRIDGRLADKPGAQVPSEAAIVVAARPRFVSRGGDKLDHALTTLDIDVTGEDVCDLGSSTGGFVDCLLRGGARRVVAVDVGYGLLDWTLRNDPRVDVLERTNARYLSADCLPFAPSFVTADLSFISLTVVLGAVLECARPGFRGLVLVKPQFEAGRERVGKGGVVRDPVVHRDVLIKVAGWLDQRGTAVVGMCDSGHPGPKGNVEYFIAFCDAREPLAATRVAIDETVLRVVETAHG